MTRPAAVASLALALTLLAAPAYSLCVEVGKPLPDVSIPSLDGGKVALSSFRGKIVLLAFWASWCPRCEEELTFLEGIYKTSPDIVVVAINQESQNVSKAHVDRIRDTLKDWKIQFPVLLDKDLDAWNKFCMNALPTSIILDKKGVVRYAEANYYWASQDKFAEVIQDIRLGR
ncbi:MAG: TlpA family protein disulfide reductase [Deltaproteobacteria bacterium]